MVQSPATPRSVTAARSREALIDAALSRFARDGFDATTTDRIAEEAGVSPRTFFRYFPTKESVVFHRDYGFMRSFAAAYLEQPSTRSDYEALRGDVRRAGGRLRRVARAHPDLPRRGRLVAGAPRTGAGALRRPRPYHRRRDRASPGRGRARCRRDPRRGRARALPACAPALARRSADAGARGPRRRGVRAAAAAGRQIATRACQATRARRPCLSTLPNELRGSESTSSI